MNEINIEQSPKPVTIKGTRKILEQMQKNICKIYRENGEGTGFFVKMRNIPVMITNHHVLDENYINDKNKEITIKIGDNKKILTIKLNENRKIYSNENYDITIIEIKPKIDQIFDFFGIR